MTYPTGILVQPLRGMSGPCWCADFDGLELAGPLGWGNTKDEAIWNLLDAGSRHGLVTFEAGHALPVREVK